MANTYYLIESQILTSAVTSVTFSSIPQTYTDLLIKASLRVGSGTVSNYSVTFNGSSSGYSEKLLYGDGSSAASASSSSASFFNWVINPNDPSQTASIFSSNEFYIPSYTAANYKSLSADNVTENNATSASAYLDAGLWSNTAAITSITMAVLGSAPIANFLTDSSFYLYGIKNS